MQEAIDYLKAYEQMEPEKLINELKTTRVGALDALVGGEIDKFLSDRDVKMKFIFKIRKWVDILIQIDEGTLKDVPDIMEKLGIEETKLKEFFQHPLFLMNALVVDIEKFTVSLDSEFVKEKIKNYKK
jgi:hypothetical protein